MRARTNISLKERKSLVLSDFRGVDFSSSVLRVKSNRASKMRNFINEYGVNRKRNGWNELHKFVGKINGIFEFDGKTIVYAGTTFYSIDKGAKIATITSPKGVDLADNRIQAFLKKGKAYIIGCGDYLVYDENGLRRVADDADTYIPTTTISIDNDTVGNDVRATLDDVNCLSSRRKNQLVGTAGFKLHTPITANTKVNIVFESYELPQGGGWVGGWVVNYTNSATGDFADESQPGTITNVLKYMYYTYEESIVYEYGDVFGYIDYESGFIELASTVFVNSKITVKYTYNNREYCQEFSGAEMSWTLDSKIKANTLVEIVLETIESTTKDSETSVSLVSYSINNKSGENKYGTELYKVKKDNVEMDKTKCGTVDFETGKITFNCQTAPQIENKDNIIVTFYHKTDFSERITKCTFGTLFGVDGNTNRLFLSGNPDYPNMDFHSEEDDFTYFSDLSAAALGSDEVAIKGYSRLSDSNLVIHKESNGRETSIFYRTGYYDTKYDENGNLMSRRGIFPLKAGSIGEGCVSTYACADFAGDSLILSPSGVYGVVLANNVATAERYLRERSRLIGEHLKRQKNLSEAVGIVYKNRYYLAVDGVCYVADARYKFTTEDDVDGSYNYEWWYWDNIPARVWAVIDEKLYFGTEDGQICVFDDKYTDRTYERIGDGKLSVGNDTFTFDETLTISESDKIILDADITVGSENLKGRELYVTKLDTDKKTFKVSTCLGGSALDFTGIDLTGISARLVNEKNVVAEWCTPVFDLGTNEASKSLLKLTLLTEPGINGKLKFGYETRNVNKLIAARGITPFSFDNLSFENFSFETGFANSYSVKCNQRNFNFIMFRFFSDSDSDCCVNSLTAIYKINKSNRGVM